MSIRDIIEGAVGDPDVWRMAKDYGYIDIDDMLGHDQEVAFIATFDPEHVALMEAVVEAAQAAAHAQQEYPRLHPDEYNCFVDDFYAALEALAAYRREKGLEPAKED